MKERKLLSVIGMLVLISCGSGGFKLSGSISGQISNSSFGPQYGIAKPLSNGSGTYVVISNTPVPCDIPFQIGTDGCRYASAADGTYAAIELFDAASRNANVYFAWIEDGGCSGSGPGWGAAHDATSGTISIDGENASITIEMSSTNGDSLIGQFTVHYCK